MERDTRAILIVAVVVIVLLFILSGRPLPLLGRPIANVDLNTPQIALIPTISPQVPEEGDADIVVDVDPGVNVDVDTAAELNPTVSTPSTVGPLLSLETPPSFISGILHGLLSPIMLVLSLLVPNVRMYAFNNIGPRYDLGFMLGIVLLLALTQFRRFRF